MALVVFHSSEDVTGLWSVTGGAECINRTPEAGVADIITHALPFPLQKGLDSIFRINLFCIVNQPLRSTIYSTVSCRWFLAAQTYPQDPVDTFPPHHLSRVTPFWPSLFVSPSHLPRGPISIPRPCAARPYTRRVLPSISARYTFARVNILENFRG